MQEGTQLFANDFAIINHQDSNRRRRLGESGPHNVTTLHEQLSQGNTAIKVASPSARRCTIGVQHSLYARGRGNEITLSERLLSGCRLARNTPNEHCRKSAHASWRT